MTMMNHHSQAHQHHRHSADVALLDAARSPDEVTTLLAALSAGLVNLSERIDAYYQTLSAAIGRAAKANNGMVQVGLWEQLNLTPPRTPPQSPNLALEALRDHVEELRALLMLPQRTTGQQGLLGEIERVARAAVARTWLREHLRETTHHTPVPVASIYNRYRQWAEENGVHALDPRIFGRERNAVFPHAVCTQLRIDGRLTRCVQFLSWAPMSEGGPQ